MDVNDLRAAVTVVLLLAFLGIVGWAWSRRNQKQFDEAAMLPFAAEGDGMPRREGEAR
ncbi:MAG: cbb3-type cytochrome c oxidase subunit 3 [Ideonella sp.]|jgi:cytochrome c oxidase cbb3-type subunit 4|nr:cbb3-type cytochrome c oxidase subunit 3 [Ideonella sp.]